MLPIKRRITFIQEGCSTSCRKQVPKLPFTKPAEKFPDVIYCKIQLDSKEKKSVVFTSHIFAFFPPKQDIS